MGARTDLLAETGSRTRALCYIPRRSATDRAASSEIGGVPGSSVAGASPAAQWVNGFTEKVHRHKVHRYNKILAFDATIDRKARAVF